MKSERWFPIQTWHPGHIKRIPWGVIQPHEAQALINHGGQTLEKLASRGGLDCSEAVAVLTDTKYPQAEAAAIRSNDERIVFQDKYNKLLREFVDKAILSAVFIPLK